jgi:Ca2+-binding RTX toxin-like protein
LNDISILRGQIPAQLQSFIPLLQGATSFINQFHPDATTYTAGHSLGGAIAEALWEHNQNTIAGGVGTESPGLAALDAAPHSNAFVHVTRLQDAIGEFDISGHAGINLTIDDLQFSFTEIPGTEVHNHILTAQQIQDILQSPATMSMNIVDGDRFLFVDSSHPNYLDSTWLSLPSATFGGDLADTLNGIGVVHDQRIEGGKGDDSIVGSLGDDSLSGGPGNDAISGRDGNDALFGGSGKDSLEGGQGNDLLVGGTGDERYSIGLYQGSDTISDSGDGFDTLALSTGDLTFSATWFSRDGNDLLIRANDAQGHLAIDIRLKDMGSTSGAIEHLDIYAGDGTQLTSTVDLVDAWQNLTQGGSPAPPPPAPPSGSIYLTDQNDNIVVGAGDHTFYSQGVGHDGIQAGNGSNVLFLDYRLQSQATSSSFQGNGAFHSQVAGGAANTTDATSVGAVIILGGAGADQMSGGSGPDVLYGGAGDDNISGGGGPDVLSGGSGDDNLTSARGSVAFVDGGSGVDTWNGDFFDTTQPIIFSSLAAASTSGITLVDGTHVQNLEKVNLQTGSGDDQITLNGQGLYAENVSTQGGNDTVSYTHVSTHENNFDGGSGTDLFIGDFSDQASGISNFYFNNGGNTGEIGTGGFNGAFFNGVSVTYSNVEAVSIIGTNFGDNLTGTAGADTLSGGGDNDNLNGGGGNDSLSGGSGDDNLSTGAGVSFIDGGAGFDTWSGNLSGLTQGVSFDMRLAMTAPGQTLVDGTHVQNIDQVSLSTGSGDDQAFFSSDFVGSNGWGAGSGTDRLTVDLSGSSQTVNLRYFDYHNLTSGTVGLGTGTQSGFGYLLFQNKLTYDGVESFNVSGGSADDNLTGGAGNDTLSGNGGDDNLDGAGGNNSLSGGAGNDNLRSDGIFGVGGNDTLSGGPGDDTLTADAGGVCFIDGGSGFDLWNGNLSPLTIGVSFNMAQAMSASGVTMADGTHVQNIEQVSLSTGSGDDQAFFGADFVGHNGWGAGGGVNKLNVDLSGSSETVTLQFFDFRFPTNGSVGLGTGTNSGFGFLNFQNDLQFNGVQSFSVAGGSAADNLNAGNGDDSLAGNGGNDNLSGNGGSDTLSGGAGDDNLNGGDGNDSLSGGSGDDVLNTSAGVSFIDGGTGFDTWNGNLGGAPQAVSFDMRLAMTAAGQTLADGTHVQNIEQVNLSTGAGDDQAIFGADFVGHNNWSAGAGVNKLIVDLSGTSQTVALAPFDGRFLTEGSIGLGVGTPNGFGSLNYQNDLQFRSIQSFSVAGGSAADNLNAGNGDDSLAGNGGNDNLSGGGGNDSLSGGAGDDNLDAGSGNNTLAGGAGDDYASGGAGIDSISAGDGNDTIIGGAGNDILAGARGNDLFVFGAGFGHDTVIDFTPGADHLQFLGVGFSSFADVMAHALQSGTNVIITDPAGDIVQLNNVLLKSLHAGDFLFA